jgi:hypothetical protein
VCGMAVSTRGFDASRFGVELNGALVGFPASVSGGESFADVVEEPPSGNAVEKHLGPRRYEPIVIESGLSMEPAWFDAVDDMLAGRGAALDGALVTLDHNNVVTRRLEWKAGLITEVAFPRADASDKSSGNRIRVVVTPQSTSLTFGGGKLAGGLGLGAKQKALVAANFRFAVTGLESASARTSQVSAITARRDENGVVRFDDVEILVSAADQAPFSAWFDGLVDGKDTERTAVLSFLDASMKDDLLRLELRLGVCRVAQDRQQNGSEAILRTRVRLYTEGVDWQRRVNDQAALEPAAVGVGAANRQDVERLAAALLDAVGAARLPPTTEAIAARLLGGAGSGETARDRGLVAGRAWAGEAARLDELQELAGVAERDEWSALALGDDHTLRAFLTTRGDLSADESVAGDLVRDEFTTGLLAGLVEVHREVAPLVEGEGALRR